MLILLLYKYQTAVIVVSTLLYEFLKNHASYISLNIPLCFFFQQNEKDAWLWRKKFYKVLNVFQNKYFILPICYTFQTILSPQTKFYSQLGQECVKAGCSVDLFLFPNAYCDVATISDICRLTSGNLYKYSYFQVGFK